ncbi:copper chaperone PCu(A)C [Orrella marina]|uniref:Copper chaperone PCu(A)C n=1 Tax=Orrella marina TaxID=2163011 RepID=A0A2R4XF94_9BURK|nr:copper chaperone PCu(A)C [Orrella marina]AWB32482.1 hypothetical protein DBV39_00735 [Orrella marina]
MSRLVSIAAAAALSLSTFASGAFAQESITSFSDSWIRGSVPGQKNGAGYLTITNQSDQPLELVSIDSDRADRIELHTIVREGGVAKMREVQGIPVPAKGEVKLEPGGYHIMFIGLKEPFKPDDHIPLVLNFDAAQPATVEFEVMPPTYQPRSGSGQNMGSHGMGMSQGQGHGHGH